MEHRLLQYFLQTQLSFGFDCSSTLFFVRASLGFCIRCRTSIYNNVDIIIYQQFSYLYQMSKQAKLTDKQKEIMKKSITRLNIPNGGVIAYSFANKQSNSGIFSNERLILLHSLQRSIRYYSKLPSILPILSYQTIQKGKQIVQIDKVNKFKHQPLKGKKDTMKITWESGKDKHEWILGMGSPKMMYEWISIIDEMIDGTLQQEKQQNQQQPNSNKMEEQKKQVNVPQAKKQSNMEQPKKQENNNFNSNSANNFNNYLQHNNSNSNKSGNHLSNNNVQINYQQNNRFQSSPKHQQQQQEQPIQKNNNQQDSQQTIRINPVQAQSVVFVNENLQMRQSHTQTQNQQPKTQSQIQGYPHNFNSLHPDKQKYLQIGYSDVASEIKYLRQKNQQKFNLTNDLSRKNLEQENQKQQFIIEQQKQEEKKKEDESNFFKKMAQVRTQQIQQERRRQKQEEERQQEQRRQQQRRREQQLQRVREEQQRIKQQQLRQIRRRQQLRNIKKQESLNRNPSNKSSQGDLRKSNNSNNSNQNINNKSHHSLNSNKHSDHSGNHHHSISNNNINIIPMNNNGNSNSRNSIAKSYKNSTIRIEEEEQEINQVQLQQKYYISKMRQENMKNTTPKSRRPLDGYQQQHVPPSPNNSIHINRTQSQSVDFFKNKNNKYKEDLSYNHNYTKSNLSRQNTNWNQQWCQLNQLQVYLRFAQQCRSVAHSIVQQVVMMKKDREYIPVKAVGQLQVYVNDNIQYYVHCFNTDSQVLTKGKDNVLLFNHILHSHLKRQFYNYNYLLYITGNKGSIKIPLCYYCEYKSVLVVCKAVIPQEFSQIKPQHNERQLVNLQQLLKIKLNYNNIKLYQHPQHKYILIGQLKQLLPLYNDNIDNVSQLQFYRHQLIMQCQQQTVIDNTNKHILKEMLAKETIPQFINKLQQLQFWMVNGRQLLEEMHKVGININCLGQLYAQANSIYVKKIIATQMVSHIFNNIIRSQLNYAMATFPTTQFEELTPSIVDNILLDCIHAMINELFSYSSKSQIIWKVIFTQIKSVYDIVISKEDILPGFLLSGVVHRNGIQTNFKLQSFKRDSEFFVDKDTIPRKLLIGFIMKERMYDLQAISQELQTIDQIISSQPTHKNFQKLVEMLNLKEKNIPDYCEKIRSQLLTYLCNFIPLGDHQQYLHIGLYDDIETQPHTFYTTKISLLAIKWLIKSKNQELANKIFQAKFMENCFWTAEFNPAITQFYDFFSLYYASSGNFEQSVKLAKSSLINVIKLLSPNSLPVADKHYQLGNLLFKIGKKEQALKQYTKTKQILQGHNQVSIPQYGIILLKLSLLYLNFGKISDCIGSAIQSLKIIDTNGGNQQSEIQTFEILARAYQITKKTNDLKNLSALCIQKFNQSENPSIFSRMVKIVLYPKLITLPPQDAKHLLQIIIKIQELQSPVSSLEAFNYLHKRSHHQILMKKLIFYLQNVSQINEQVVRNNAYRKHRSLCLETKSESDDLLVMLQAIAKVIGFDFIVGSLRQNCFG